MNTLEIDHVLKKHPSTRNVFKGVYTRNRLPRRLNVPSALIGNTDSDDRPGTYWVSLMHKSLDYVCGFSRVYQCSRSIAHGFFGTSVYHIKYTVVSAYSGAFFLNSDGGVFIDANSRGEYYDPTGRPPFSRAYVNFMNKHCTSWTYNSIRVQEEGSIPIKTEGTLNLLGSLFLAYTPLKTFLVLGCVFSTWSISKVFI
jgi:hypothetical protein